MTIDAYSRSPCVGDSSIVAAHAVNSVPATIDRTVIEERLSMPNPRGHRPLPSNITHAGARVFRKPDPPYGHLDWDGWRESSRTGSHEEAHHRHNTPYDETA